jgi:hypothetical protein
MNVAIRDFVLAVLKDDHGISEQAWEELHEMLQSLGELETLGEVTALVDACDGRFFIK